MQVIITERQTLSSGVQHFSWLIDQLYFATNFCQQDILYMLSANQNLHIFDQMTILVKYKYVQNCVCQNIELKVNVLLLNREASRPSVYDKLDKTEKGLWLLRPTTWDSGVFHSD